MNTTTSEAGITDTSSLRNGRRHMYHVSLSAPRSRFRFVLHHDASCVFENDMYIVLWRSGSWRRSSGALLLCMTSHCVYLYLSNGQPTSGDSRQMQDVCVPSENTKCLNTAQDAGKTQNGAPFALETIAALATKCHTYRRIKLNAAARILLYV